MRLRYGQVQRSAMNWPFYVANELDLFAEGGLAIEPEIFASPPAAVMALLDGSLDVIHVVPDVVLLEVEDGAPLSVIANPNNRPQYRLMAPAGVGDARELAGHTIGVNDGRSGDILILRKIMREGGLAPDSYVVEACGPPLERCARLRGGTLGAAMLSQPFDLMLEAEGFRAVASSSEIVPLYPFAVCVIRREGAIREDTLSFLQCIRGAWHWMADRSNRERAAAVLSRFTKTSEDQAERTYDLYLRTPSPPSLAPTPGGITTVLELLAGNEQLPVPLPPPEKFIDRRYFERLHRAG